MSGRVRCGGENGQPLKDKCSRCCGDKILQLVQEGLRNMPGLSNQRMRSVMYENIQEKRTFGRSLAWNGTAITDNYHLQRHNITATSEGAMYLRDITPAGMKALLARYVPRKRNTGGRKAFRPGRAKEKRLLSWMFALHM